LKTLKATALFSDERCPPLKKVVGAYLMVVMSLEIRFVDRRPEKEIRLVGVVRGDSLWLLTRRPSSNTPMSGLPE